MFENVDLKEAAERVAADEAAAERVAADEAAAERVAADEAAGKINLSDFTDFFKGGFSAAAAFTHLKSLEIQEGEVQGAEATARKLYTIIDRTPILSRLLYSQKELCDWFLVASFVGGKTVSVVAEVRGVKNSDVLAGIAEKAGEKFAGGILSRLAFWKRK